MIEQLTAIGLSRREALLYVTLARYGTRTTSFIAKKANFNRGTAYVVLHSLLDKGLVVKSSRRGVQYFTSLDPKQLLTYVDRKREELLAHKKRISAVIAQLAALTNPLATKPQVEFFSGQEGARSALEDTLSAREKVLRAFLSIADVAAFVGAEFFEKYTSRRIRAGFTLHAIRTLEKDKQALAANIYARRYMTSREERREIRYVSDELAFPVTIYTYDNRLMILSSKEENFALLIESAELAEMQKKLFELIWASLKKTTP